MRALLAALMVSLLLPSAFAQQAQEHEIKAAFLYKFPAFIDWPEGKAGRDPFVIAVAGAAEVAAELGRVAEGREIRGRPIRVRVLAEAELPVADLVFVGRDSPRLAQLARALAGTPTLLVSEVPGGLERGAMINFLVTEGRVRFEVAPATAERSGLRLSSRLLSVAQSVRNPRL